MTNRNVFSSTEPALISGIGFIGDMTHPKDRNGTPIKHCVTDHGHHPHAMDHTNTTMPWFEPTTNQLHVYPLRKKNNTNTWNHHIYLFGIYRIFSTELYFYKSKFVLFIPSRNQEGVIFSLLFICVCQWTKFQQNGYTNFTQFSLNGCLPHWLQSHCDAIYIVSS